MGVHFKNAGNASYADEVELQGNISGVLGIDKVVIVAQVPEKELIHYEDYRAKINLAFKSGFDVKWDGRANRNGYKNSVRITTDSGTPKNYPLFQFDPYGKHQGFMRLEFNPNNLGNSGIYALKWWMDNTSPHGWPAFREWGGIKRIDVNLDIDEPVSGFIWDSRYSVSRERFMPNGRLESIYLGKKEWGKNYTRIYDWNACHDPSALNTKTRIERKQTPNCGLKELGEMTNAFDGLRVYHANIPPPDGYPFGMWQLYLGHLSKVGLRSSLFFFEPGERESIKKHIQSCKAANLDLQDVWKAWPGVVDKLGLSSPGPHGPKIPFIDASVPKDLLGQA